ncbi:MAG: hypothetical protein CL927_14010 [Deltaproteobacteria bacterium]|nr:hypothetical protein [Deltaproteobacteria bacterium]
MRKARIVFTVFTVLFLPLYSLMCLMYVDELMKETNALARAIDVGILALGVVFMGMQAVMARLLWKGDRNATLRTMFLAGLVVWFSLEVVLGYSWCFVTGADPLTQHTPFVAIFVVFNAAQIWALRTLGVLGGDS